MVNYRRESSRASETSQFQKWPNVLTTVNSPIKMFAKSTTDTIKSHRICTTVGEWQDEPDHSQNVPEVVVVFSSIGTILRGRKMRNARNMKRPDKNWCKKLLWELKKTQLISIRSGGSGHLWRGRLFKWMNANKLLRDASPPQGILAFVSLYNLFTLDKKKAEL